jgi:hypothetical protein
VSLDAVIQHARRGMFWKGILAQLTYTLSVALTALASLRVIGTDSLD